MPDSPSQHGQRIAISHLDQSRFERDGLRSYSSYRDLGVATATEGLVQAHVIRMTEAFRPELGGRHYHQVQFQMVYVLKGWFSTEFEGGGTHVFREGSCWTQPPGIRHSVRGWSQDCELLEIIMPAAHETVSDPVS